MDKAVKANREALRMVNKEIIGVSALHKIGIEEVLETIFNKFIQVEGASEAILLSKMRYKEALEQSLMDIHEYSKGVCAQKSLEYLSADLRSAVGWLEGIIGIISQEDIYDKIFSSFCIGK